MSEVLTEIFYRDANPYDIREILVSSKLNIESVPQFCRRIIVDVEGRGKIILISVDSGGRQYLFEKLIGSSDSDSFPLSSRPFHLHFGHEMCVHRQSDKKCHDH
jgi:hypothetical protein